jgi:predicted PurR-regulated permease PerM
MAVVMATSAYACACVGPCPIVAQAHRVWRRGPIVLAHLPARRTVAAMPNPGPTVRLAAPSLRGVVRLVAFAAACAIGLYLVWRTRGVLRLAAIALFVALTLNPIVDALDRRIPIPRAAVILLLYVALAGGIVVTGAVVVPSTVRQVQQLSRDAPAYLHDLRRNGTFRRYDDRYAITAKLQRDASALPGRLQQAAGPLQRVTVQAFGVVSQLLTVLSLAFLLMLHGREYMGMALRLTGDREARYRALVIDINRAVAKYMLGNVAISGLATVATWLVLTLLGVPYALSLGLLVGFFDLIPLVGATLGAIFVAIATATVDFPTATIVWLAFIIVYQRVENSFIQPVVYGRALQVNPIVTILAVLVGASLLGILGALLAIPIAAAIQILLRDWWTHRPVDDVTDAYAPAQTGSSAELAQP